MATLFERIGGAQAVEAAVDRFYEIVVADERIRHFFAAIDMKRQASHQKAFFKFAFGGLPTYPGRSLRAAHERLVRDQGLADSHFDAVLDDLGQTLRGMGVAEDMIGEVIVLADSTRKDVLNQ